MAHALRLISNKGYNCYGDGRDWFFMGDPSYRDGARTPLPNQTGPKLVKPPARPRGAAREMAHQRSCVSAKGRVKEKWQKIHDECPEHFGPAQQKAKEQEHLARTGGGRRKDRDQSPFATTYDQLGRHPKWRGDRYVLDNAEVLKTVGVPRSSSEPVLKEMEGDHTRGVRGSKAHFASVYQQVGDGVPGMPAQRVVVPNAENLRDACVPPKAVPPKAKEGDHSQGIKGPTADFMHSTYSELGRQPMPQWMGPRHQHAHSEELRDAGVIPLRERPKELEGDHSRGIRGETPHHFTTSQSYGRFQKFEGKRYDFGPIANKQYRLTTWV